MTDHIHRRLTHKSIIRAEIYPDNDPIEYISDDEYNGRISSTSIKITTQCQHDLINENQYVYDNDTNISSDDIHRSSKSLFVRAPHDHRFSSSGNFHRNSPVPSRQTHQPRHLATTVNQSRSLQNLSHLTLEKTMTGDSGTGELIEHTHTVASTQPLDYGVVPVFGQKRGVVLMADRFGFDQRKIDEYFGKKCQKNLKTSNVKPSLSSTKSNSLIQHLRSMFQHPPPPVEEIFIEPIVRYHSSRVERKESH